MKQKTIYVFTHDSIAVGEDGATHEPCEQLWGLRTIPNMHVWRPANMAEVKASYMSSLTANNSSCIILSRQKLTASDSDFDAAIRGGYIISSEANNRLDAIIIATGSEVGLSLEIQGKLAQNGVNARIVSMPSIEVFEEQSPKYKNSVIDTTCPYIFTIEAGSTCGWYKYASKKGKCYGVDDFGGSATPDELFQKFNLTSDYIAKDILKTLR